MLTSMGDVMREAYRRGWITTRDGNISLRRRDSFYITPSGGRKAIIQPEHIVKGKVDKFGWLHFKDLGGVKPSGELEMHRLLQTSVDFKGCRSVVHLHPTYTIAAMFAGWDLYYLGEMFPELGRYTKVAPMVPILPVTSEILATSTFDKMTKYKDETLTGEPHIAYDIVGQNNHGVCAIGRSPWDAFEHIERLEHVCQIVLSSGAKAP